jgi:hypothetical protein
MTEKENAQPILQTFNERGSCEAVKLTLPRECRRRAFNVVKQ